MNWFVNFLIKEARQRRFRSNDRVRYFTENRKGTGKGVVLTPSFSKGTVVDFDAEARRYKVRDDKDTIIDVHPRNLIPDVVSRIPISTNTELSNISIEEPIGQSSVGNNM